MQYSYHMKLTLETSTYLSRKVTLFNRKITFPLLLFIHFVRDLHTKYSISTRKFRSDLSNLNRNGQPHYAQIAAAAI